MNRKASKKGVLLFIVILSLLVFIPQALRVFFRIQLNWLFYEMMFGEILAIVTVTLLIFALILDLVEVYSEMFMKSVKILLIFSLLILYIVPFLQKFFAPLRILPVVFPGVSVVIALIATLIVLIDSFKIY
ncbi:MAG: hypothetical protein QXS41_02445 [Candidatus Woesearchaeota archaeon]